VATRVDATCGGIVEMETDAARTAVATIDAGTTLRRVFPTIPPLSEAAGGFERDRSSKLVRDGWTAGAV